MHHALRLLRDHGRRSSLLPSAAATAATASGPSAVTASTGVKVPIVAPQPQAEAESTRATAQRLPRLPKPTQPLPSGSGSAALQRAAAVLRPPPPSAAMEESSSDVELISGQLLRAAKRERNPAPSEQGHGRGAAGRLAGLLGGPRKSANSIERHMHPRMRQDLDAGLSMAQARLLHALRSAMGANKALTPAQLVAHHDTTWAKYSVHNQSRKLMRQSHESWAILLKDAEAKNDAKTLGALGRRALAWARVQPAPEDGQRSQTRRMEALVANLQARFSARTGYVWTANEAVTLWRMDDFGHAAQLRTRLVPPPRLRPPLPPHMSRHLPLGQGSRHGMRPLDEALSSAWRGMRPPRPSWLFTHVSPATAARVRSALNAALEARRAEQLRAEQRRRAGVLPPSALERDEIAHSDVGYAGEAEQSAEAMLRAWQEHVAAREDMRARIQGQVVRKAGMSATPVPPTWLVLAALRARAERGEVQRAREMVQVYLRSFLAQPKPFGTHDDTREGRQKALAIALHNGARTYAVSSPHLPPRGASLLNLVLRAHVIAGATIEEALESLAQLTGYTIHLRSGAPDSPAPPSPSRSHAADDRPALVPDEQTLLLLLVLLRPLRNRAALGLRLAEDFTLIWSPHAGTHELARHAPRQLFLGTRTARALLRWSLNTDDRDATAVILRRHAGWTSNVRRMGRGAQMRDAARGLHVKKGEVAMWESLRPTSGKGERFKWDRLNAKLRDTGWFRKDKETGERILVEERETEKEEGEEEEQTSTPR